MIARFVAEGVPVPQGSKTAIVVGRWFRHLGRRACYEPRAVVVEGVKIKRADGTRSDGRERHRRWRQTVRLAAIDFQRRTGWETTDNPVSIAVTFYLPRPISAPRRVLYPAKKPDLDKLARAVFDSLKGVIVRDDGLVVSLSAHKRFAIGGVPRAEIMVERLAPLAMMLPL